MVFIVGLYIPCEQFLVVGSSKYLSSLNSSLVFIFVGDNFPLAVPTRGYTVTTWN